MRKSAFLIVLLFTTIICLTSCTQPSDYDMIYASDKSGNFELYLVDIGTKKESQITNYKLRDGYVEISPDGKKIVSYAYHDEGKTWSIHLMNIDGSDRKRLTTKVNVWDACPNWSPNGNMILFSRKEDGFYKTMLMNSDGSNLRQLNMPFAVHPRFTNEYDIIYVSHWEDHAEIFVADTTGNIINQLTNNNFREGDPVISPDGKKVVFYSYRDGNSEIYTMNIDGSEHQRLTFNDYDDWTPAWSPDGNKIAFNGYRNQIFDIFIMNSDGSELTNITNSEHSESGPCWIVK